MSAVPSRVTVVQRDSVEMSVRARIAGEVQWLRRELIPRLDAELGVSFPPVIVFQECWRNEKEKGFGPGFALGRVAPFPFDGCHWFTVQLPAASLLSFQRDLVEGVLAHEFLHYVWWSLGVQRAHATGAVTLEQDIPGYLDGSADDYQRLDRTQAVEASQWLSERLQVLVRRIENSDSREVMAGLQRIQTDWVNKDLPVVSLVDLRFHVDGLLATDKNLMEVAQRSERGHQL